ncbi:MAG: site-specific integrase [Treponema sp.]|nr:site-specific integrase [Treponema sp.]
MLEAKGENQLFKDYFFEWMEVYKKGMVRNVTYQKYKMTHQRLSELSPQLTLNELNKRNYQHLINEYAKTHEKQTTMDFHHHLKSAILDAIDEGLVKTDPTRKVVIKGKSPTEKKAKFLSFNEVQELLKVLDLTWFEKNNKINWDWLILFLLKTGLRFAEALGITPNDFDFENRKVKISKTWGYKKIDETGSDFAETKNSSSKRTIIIDEQLNEDFFLITKDLEQDKPLFVRGRVFNSTPNARLESLCKKADITVISLHGLRHTHASLLIFAGVSIASIAKRLGHANTTTTQEVYLHIIKELEDKDNEIVISHLSKLNTTTQALLLAS